MSLRDAARMKLLALELHRLWPEMSARIDQLPKAPGFPRRAVVVEPFPGLKEVLPALRYFAWPERERWLGLKVAFDVDTMHILSIDQFDSFASNDEEAPFWLLKEVLRFYRDDFLNPTLDSHGAHSLEDLPEPARQAMSPWFARVVQLEGLLEP